MLEDVLQTHAAVNDGIQVLLQRKRVDSGKGRGGGWERNGSHRRGLCQNRGRSATSAMTAAASS
jgi:hypothetical protein